MAWINDALGYNQFGDLDYGLVKKNRELNKVKKAKDAARSKSRAELLAKRQELLSKAYDDNQSMYIEDYHSLLSQKYPTLTAKQLSQLPFDTNDYLKLDAKYRNGNKDVMRSRLEQSGFKAPNADMYKKFKMNELEEDYIPPLESKPIAPYQTTQYDSVDDAKLNRINEYRNNKSQDEIDADNAMYGNLPYSQSVANNVATYDTADQVKMKRILAERAAKPPGVNESMYAESAYETGVKNGTVAKDGITSDMWNPSTQNAERNMKVRANYDNANVRNSNVYQNPYEGNDPVRAQKYDNAQGKLGIQSAKGYDMVQDVNRMREITGIARTKNRMPDSFYGMSPEQAEDAIQRYGYPSKDNPYKFDYTSGNSKWEIDEAKRMGTTRIPKSSPSPRPISQPSLRPISQSSPRPVTQSSPRPEPMRADTNLLSEGWTDTGMSWDGSKPGRLPYQDNRPAKVVPPVSQANKSYYDNVGMFNDSSNRVRRF